MTSISGRFFKNQPNDICRHLSEKASKDRFLGPDNLQNHTNKGKERRKRKSEEEEKRRRQKKKGMVALPSFYIRYIGDTKKVLLPVRFQKSV